MTGRDLDAIREGTTPGPWYANVDDLVGGWQVASVDKPASQLSREDRVVGLFFSEADARMVAASPALVGRIQELEAKLGAATTMLAEAERIVPGVITTAGRLSIGLNDRERAVKAEADLAKREQWWADKHLAEQQAANRMVVKAEAERDTLQASVEAVAMAEDFTDVDDVQAALRVLSAQGAGGRYHRTVSSGICNRSVATESYAHDHSYLAERAEMAEADCDRLWVALREIADLARAATAQGAGE